MRDFLLLLSMIVKLAETNIKTKFGDFKETLFYNGQRESHSLVMGDIEGEEDILCRVHSSCIFAHQFNSIECDCREQMEISQQLIQKVGKGIVIWLEQEGKGNGHYALIKSMEHKKNGIPQAEAYEKVGITVDDAPFVAVDFEVSMGVNQQILTFETNVGDHVMAGPDNPIRVERDPETGEPSPYVMVRANLEALIDRKSFYRLVDIGAHHEGWFGLWSGGAFFDVIPSDELPE